MTNFNALLLIVALAIPATFVFFYIDGLLLKRIETIATGMIRGVPVSLQHRRLMLYYSWGMNVWVGVGFCAMLVLMWILIARNIADPTLQSFAYLAAFFVSCGVLNWGTQYFFWYRHLASILRQAEAG